MIWLTAQLDGMMDTHMCKAATVVVYVYACMTCDTRRFYGTQCLMLIYEGCSVSTTRGYEAVAYHAATVCSKCVAPARVHAMSATTPPITIRVSPSCPPLRGLKRGRADDDDTQDYNHADETDDDNTQDYNHADEMDNTQDYNHDDEAHEEPPDEPDHDGNAGGHCTAVRWDIVNVRDIMLDVLARRREGDAEEKEKQNEDEEKQKESEEEKTEEEEGEASIDDELASCMRCGGVDGLGLEGGRVAIICVYCHEALRR